MQGKCRLHGATIKGVEALLVEVEVSIGSGIPGFTIVGMPDASIQESRERVKAAIKACGFTMPSQKIVVNLAPSALRKTGSGFDLPIALGILGASGQIPLEPLRDVVLVGELSLEGLVRPVAGLLACALCAARKEWKLVSAYTHELSSMSEHRCLEVTSLHDFMKPLETYVTPCTFQRSTYGCDFADIAGHEMTKRALVIAAVGQHGVLMMGPPGSGKTMLASRIGSILPPLSKAERIEAAVIHSVAGLDSSDILAGVRPFRAPHHSISLAGLVGGGSPLRPGEISLAHHGVLFLDEMAEFSPAVLQGIRQPLESGVLTLTRAEGSITFPSKFMLMAATNPCPCGNYGSDEAVCKCTLPQIKRYQGRIGGPLLDRIDMHLEVMRMKAHAVMQSGSGTSSAQLHDEVMRGCEFRDWRLARTGGENPRQSKALVEACQLSCADQCAFEALAQQSRLSGRGIIRTLSLARTIADLAESNTVGIEHIYEAFALRLREESDDV